MKCCVNNTTKEVKRLSDERAAELVSKGWTYCSKKRWKTEVRDVAAKTITILVDMSTNIPPEQLKEVKKAIVSGRQRAKKLSEN